MKLGEISRRVLGVVACLVLAVGAQVSLAGCVNEGRAIQEVLTSELDDLKNVDETQLRDILGDEDFDQLASIGVDTQAFYGGLFKHFSYEVGDISVDGADAQVALTVTNVDLESVLKDWVVSVYAYMFSSEGLAVAMGGDQDAITAKMYGMLTDALEAEDAPTKTADVTIDLVKKDTKWQIADRQQLASAVFAGADLSNIFSDLSSEL